MQSPYYGKSELLLTVFMKNGTTDILTYCKLSYDSYANDYGKFTAFNIKKSALWIFIKMFTL